MTSANKHPFPALGDNLRHRYDEAFIRNEVTNLRDQVTVLHDTLGDFITRIDKRLLGHDEVQRKLGSRIAQLERLFKFKSTESPKKPSLAVVVSPTKSPKQTRDTPSSIEGGEPGTSDSEPAVSMTNSYRILDVHGNEFVAIRYGEGTEEEGDGTNAVLISSDLPTAAETEEDVKEDDSDVDVDGDVAEGSEELMELEAPVTGRRRGGSATHATMRTKSSKMKPLDWDQLEAESRTMISLPERKGKGGKVSGRLGVGSPAWTHYLRTAIRRSLGDQAMLRYAREGSRIFKVEQEESFAKIKERVVDFCARHQVHPPEDKLMDEIACAFLRNKKRYRAKL